MNAYNLREFDRLFEDWLTPSIHARRASSHFVPAYEVEEADDHYLLTLELAGVRKEDIGMETRDNQIVISGEKRRYGKFQRTFALPPGVDLGKVEATYQDGVLRVAVPKMEEAKPRQIKISSESGGSKFLSRILSQSPKPEPEAAKEKVPAEQTAS